MGFLHTLRFITSHPLTESAKVRALLRFAGWQVRSRLTSGAIIVPFANGAQLSIRHGMTGATGNVYTGLHDFEDMAFLLHLMRGEDFFADIGANVGTYTVLAAKGIGAHCIAAEPVTSAYGALIDNLELNRIVELVEVQRAAVGREAGTVRMTTDHDAANHVSTENETGAAIEEAPLITLDQLCRDVAPSLMKIDVEGYESEVLAGGAETLARESLNAIIMETNACAELYGRAASDADDQLRSLGFETYRYDPLDRSLNRLETHNPSRNTIYIRDRAAAAERVENAPPFHVFGRQI